MRTLLIGAALFLSACTGGVTIPRQPFEDVPVPREWTSYSSESVITQTPDATSAKLVYFSGTKPDATLAQARRLLAQAGWTETKSERFVNSEKFPGQWAEFSKGKDVCRVTVIEGAYATHVDYTVLRVPRSP